MTVAPAGTGSLITTQLRSAVASTVRRKGVASGLLDTALNAIPVVGGVKTVAVTAGYMLDLDELQLRNALGIAASRAGALLGTPEAAVEKILAYRDAGAGDLRFDGSLSRPRLGPGPTPQHGRSRSQGLIENFPASPARTGRPDRNTN